MPHLLVLGTTVPVASGDGTPGFVLDLTRHLATQHGVTILAPRAPGAPRRSVVDGVVVERFAYFPRRWERLADGAILPNLRNEPHLAIQVPFLMIAFLVATLRRIRRDRPDLIHAHWFIPAGVIASLCHLMTGVPFLVTGHGADVFALQGPVAGRIRRWVAGTAAVVGATSEDLRHEIGPIGDTPVFVAPMGVDVEQISNSVGDLEPEHGRFLFIGRLADKKGVDTAIQALEGLEGACLVIGGDGPDRRALEELARKLGLTPRVTFLGQVDRAQLARELRRAHALVVPSRVARDGDQDTTPLVMSEAMSAGVPVLASALGGLAERIDDGRTGILARPDDVQDWHHAMQRALDDGQLRTMGRRAQEEIHGSPLDLRATAEVYLEEIDRVVR